MKMKRKVKTIMITLLLIVGIIGTITSVHATNQPTIVMNKKSIVLEKGKKTTIKATVNGRSKVIKWKSSNTTIASVQNGKVTAKKAGTTIITATANGVSAKCTVQVLTESNAAKASYNKFLKANKKGCYYAIINAGINKAPILITTDAFRNRPYSQFKYDGYSITLYTYKNGKVICNSKDIPQRISAGPWYYYRNKLYTRGGRGGYYYRLDVKSKGYVRTFINGENYTIFKDSNIVKLKYVK